MLCLVAANSQQHFYCTYEFEIKTSAINKVVGFGFVLLFFFAYSVPLQICQSENFPLVCALETVCVSVCVCERECVCLASISKS